MLCNNNVQVQFFVFLIVAELGGWSMKDSVFVRTEECVEQFVMC